MSDDVLHQLYLDTTTLQSLYLELANVVPKDCISLREIALRKTADRYGTDNARLEKELADAIAVLLECWPEIERMRDRSEDRQGYDELLRDMDRVINRRKSA